MGNANEAAGSIPTSVSLARGDGFPTVNKTIQVNSKGKISMKKFRSAATACSDVWVTGCYSTRHVGGVKPRHRRDGRHDSNKGYLNSFRVQRHSIPIIRRTKAGTATFWVE